jgi:hypothetical protein
MPLRLKIQLWFGNTVGQKEKSSGKLMNHWARNFLVRVLLFADVGPPFP